MMTIIAVQIKEKLKLKRAPLNFFTSQGFRIFDIDQILALRKEKNVAKKEKSEIVKLFCQESPIFKSDTQITERKAACDMRTKPLLEIDLKTYFNL